MPKYFLRIVVLVLIPTLGADPVAAFAVMNSLSLGRGPAALGVRGQVPLVNESCFQEQALAEVAEFVRAVLQISAIKGRHLINDEFAYAIEGSLRSPVWEFQDKQAEPSSLSRLLFKFARSKKEFDGGTPPQAPSAAPTRIPLTADAQIREILSKAQSGEADLSSIAASIVQVLRGMKQPEYLSRLEDAVVILTGAKVSRWSGLIQILGKYWRRAEHIGLLEEVQAFFEKERLSEAALEQAKPPYDPSGETEVRLSPEDVSKHLETKARYLGSLWEFYDVDLAQSLTLGFLEAAKGLVPQRQIVLQAMHMVGIAARNDPPISKLLGGYMYCHWVVTGLFGVVLPLVELDSTLKIETGHSGGGHYLRITFHGEPVAADYLDRIVNYDSSKPENNSEVRDLGLRFMYARSQGAKLSASNEPASGKIVITMNFRAPAPPMVMEIRKKEPQTAGDKPESTHDPLTRWIDQRRLTGRYQEVVRQVEQSVTASISRLSLSSRLDRLEGWDEQGAFIPSVLQGLILCLPNQGSLQAARMATYLYRTEHMALSTLQRKIQAMLNWEIEAMKKLPPKNYIDYRYRLGLEVHSSIPNDRKGRQIRRLLEFMMHVDGNPPVDGVGTNYQAGGLEFQSLPSYSWRTQELIWDLWEDLARAEAYGVVGELEAPVDQVWLHINVNGKLDKTSARPLLYLWVRQNAELAKSLAVALHPAWSKRYKDRIWMVRNPGSSKLGGIRTEITGMMAVSYRPKFQAILRRYRRNLISAINEAVWAIQNSDTSKARRILKRVQNYVGPDGINQSSTRLLQSLQQYYKQVTQKANRTPLRRAV